MRRAELSWLPPRRWSDWAIIADRHARRSGARPTSYGYDDWDGSRRAQARLKNLTSQLIGRFAVSSARATREAYPQASLIRFGANVVVPRSIQAEIAVLKGIVATFVMSRNTRQPIYARQRTMLSELADVLLSTGEANLDPGFAEDWRRASNDAQRKRAVVDQVASLTDQSAIAWFERLCHAPRAAD